MGRALSLNQGSQLILLWVAHHPEGEALAASKRSQIPVWRLTSFIFIKLSECMTDKSPVPQQGMYTQSGGLMYWIPPPDQGSAPVCLGTALSPEEAAGAQARMQQSTQTGAFNQSYSSPMNTTPTGNISATSPYQAAPFAGGNYGQASSPYPSFPSHTGAPAPASIPGTSNNSGSINTSGPARTSIPASTAGPRSNWNPAGGTRAVNDRPGSGTGAPVSTASPATSTPTGQWFNPPPAAASNTSNSMRPYDPYANEFIPGRSDSTSRNGQGWNK